VSRPLKWAVRLKLEESVQFQPKQVGWGLWLQWVAASAAGFAGTATAFRALGALLTDTTPAWVGGSVSTAVALAGASLPGFLHWLILRRRFARAGWWILASGVGALVGFLILGVGLAGADTGRGLLFISDRYAVDAAALCAGAVAGATQWLVLRQWVGRAGWWVLASSVSWLGATYAYVLSTRANDVRLPLVGAAAGVLSGAITASVLVWLMRHTKQNARGQCDTQKTSAGQSAATDRPRD
jgi:hypothetical protein